jgi:hypothetical protein
MPLFHSKSKTRRCNKIKVAVSAVTGTGAVLADSQQAKRVRAVVCCRYAREADKASRSYLILEPVPLQLLYAVRLRA